MVATGVGGIIPIHWAGDGGCVEDSGGLWLGLKGSLGPGER